MFYLVHRQLPTYDASRPLRPWLFGFAFRVASDYRRQARHRFEVAGLEIEGADPAPGIDEQLIAAEDQAFIEAALRLVPLERRAVLILHEIEGCSAPAIAAALGVPLNTGIFAHPPRSSRSHCGGTRARTETSWTTITGVENLVTRLPFAGAAG